MDDMIQLIGPGSYEQNDIGEMVSTLDTVSCYATIRSVTRAEWQAAGRKGLNPSYVITTNRVNYQGQTMVEYQGRRYAIYRTYCPPDSDDIELYVQEEVGVTDG